MRFVGLCLALITVALDASATTSLLPDFQLLDQQGRAHTLRRYKDVDAVAILAAAPGTPVDAPRLAWFCGLAERFADKQVLFFVMTPADTWPVAAWQQKPPVLLDDAQVILPALGLQHEFSCVLARPANGTVLYRGDVGEADQGLEVALDAMGSGKTGTASLAPTGPLLALEPMPQPPSYTRDVAPILERRCVTCHSEGNIGPFNMDSHRRVAGRAEMMAESIRNGNMPPWNADPRFGHFSNAMGLNRDEKRTLLAWLDAGAPKDGDADPLAAIVPSPVPAWKLGQPDLVVKLPEPQTIPAEGVLDYRYYEVPLDLPPGTWLRGTEVRITQPQVMHHVLVYMRREGEDIDFTQEYIASYVPGHDPGLFPEGTGKPVPDRARLLFQLHYTPNGREVIDTPELGIHLCKEPPTHEVFLGSAVNRDFSIPPHATDAELSAVFRAPQDLLVYSFAPHMHYRGKRMSFEAIYPDGRREMLLSVPAYNFYWQHSYHLAEPLRIPRGTVIQVDGAFDNSVRNPINPDPSQPLRWGDQSTNEMYIGSILYRAAG